MACLNGLSVNLSVCVRYGLLATSKLLRNVIKHHDSINGNVSTYILEMLY